MANYRDVPRILTAALVTQYNLLRTDAATALLREENSVLSYPLIADGTTAGKAKTTNTTVFRIGGTLYTKAATDDLWDLSLQTDTTGAQYRAYWLYLDSSLAASVAAGTNAASAALAIAALPAIVSTKSVIGCYVAGLSTDFNGVAGLDSYGTYYNGFPAGYTATAGSVTIVAA